MKREVTKGGGVEGGYDDALNRSTAQAYCSWRIRQCAPPSACPLDLSAAATTTIPQPSLARRRLALGPPLHVHLGWLSRSCSPALRQVVAPPRTAPTAAPGTPKPPTLNTRMHHTHNTPTHPCRHHFGSSPRRRPPANPSPPCLPAVPPRLCSRSAPQPHALLVPFSLLGHSGINLSLLSSPGGALRALRSRHSAAAGGGQAVSNAQSRCTAAWDRHSAICRKLAAVWRAWAEQRR